MAMGRSSLKCSSAFRRRRRTKRRVDPHAQRTADYRQRSDAGRASVAVDLDVVDAQAMLVAQEFLPPDYELVDYQLASRAERKSARDRWGMAVTALVALMVELTARGKLRELLARL
jgi:hypothetical protein